MSTAAADDEGGCHASQGFYLPFCLLAFSVMVGGNWVADVLGILGGHLYYFLKVRGRHPGVNLATLLWSPFPKIPIDRELVVNMRWQHEPACTAWARAALVSSPRRCHVITVFATASKPDAARQCLAGDPPGGRRRITGGDADMDVRPWPPLLSISWAAWQHVMVQKQ